VAQAPFPPVSDAPLSRGVIFFRVRFAAMPTAVVTGAARGIGREVARQLAERGLRVVVTARSPRKAALFADELGADAVPATLDVADPDSIAGFARRMREEVGACDVLVNNAAIDYDTDQRAVDADLERVARDLNTNLFGAWRLTQALLPLLRKSGHGRIVNVSSGAGQLHDMGGGTPAYKLSKVGLNALTRMLSAELRSDRILVNAICPGWVATDMGGHGGRSPEDGAKGIVWAATLPDDGPTGGFFRDGRTLEW
jgi:NAD(P)-dependent dehydrogenase (short-subunit alcohol dehydrogenase family)